MELPHHHSGNAEQQPRPGCQHGARAHRDAKQDHGELQQELGTEIDAGSPAVARRPGGADGGADQDGQHKRLQPGGAGQPGLDPLQPDRRQSDADAKQQARHNPAGPRLEHPDRSAPKDRRGGVARHRMDGS
jgi:hypothetical protein